MNKKNASLNLHYLLFLSIAMWSSVIRDAQGEDTRPNVIVIMSDDQGGGDYGFMGNDIIRTPELDKIVSHSGLLTEFYVSPVCAPTRESHDRSLQLSHKMYRHLFGSRDDGSR